MEPELDPMDHSMSSPVVIFGWIAASCTALVGALALVPGVPPVVPAVVAAIGFVATSLLGFATKAKVTPWKDVVAKVTPSGRTVAGPAANAATPATMPVNTGDEVEIYKTAA
jgi:hypothetical protein